MSRHVGPQSLAMFDALVLAAALYCASLPAVAQHRLPAAIFDSDPNHIWNRTHSCLFVRQSADGTDYGADALRDAAGVTATQEFTRFRAASSG